MWIKSLQTFYKISLNSVVHDINKLQIVRMLHDRTTLVVHIHVYKTQPTMTIIMLIQDSGLVS